VITQRLILDGAAPDAVLTCVGCHSPLIEGRIQHPDNCPELRKGNAAGTLPSVAQITAWLAAHGWAQIDTGPGGSLWCPPDRVLAAVATPPGDGYPDYIAGALERIASRSGLPFGEVLTAMRAAGVGENSDG
jgi:hypothetical protein